MHLGTIDYPMEVAAGRVSGEKVVNKYGECPSGLQVTDTDVWDLANATPTQQIWLAPTAARIHTIASTSASDDTGSTGANSVIITYMADWDSQETTETVTGDLNAGIVMENAAVIIHRMIVVPQATSTTANAGLITATAATDGTVTAAIQIGLGQTQMAIYGVPSGCNLFMHDIQVTANKGSGGTVTANMSLMVNPNPDVQTVTFINKHKWGCITAGSSAPEVDFHGTPKKIAGPAIVKLQGISSAADLDVSAWFNGILQDKNE